MKKECLRSIILKSFIIPAGGFLILAICYMFYFAIYMFVESMLFTDNPTAVPAGMIRNSYTIALLVIYFTLLRTRMSDLLKAITLIAPVAMLIIAGILALYITPVLAVVFTAAIEICCCFLLYRYKKPWFYYYATAIAVLAAVAYAWPRA